MNANLTVHLKKRVSYAFVGLLAGDAILFFYLIGSAFLTGSFALVEHVGDPAGVVLTALEIFFIYAVISFIGWLLVGLPIVLLIRPDSLIRLPWFLRVLVGALLGPVALFAIFGVLATHGRVNFRPFAGGLGLWAYSISIVISTVAFLVYVGLLGKEKPAE
jgi:hypothetical protein